MNLTLVRKDAPDICEQALERRVLESRGDINVRQKCTAQWYLSYFLNAPGRERLKGYARPIPDQPSDLVECDGAFVTESGN